MDYTISGKGVGDSGIGITGTGTIVGNNESVLNIQVEIEGSASTGVGGGRLEQAGSDASPEGKESSTPLFNI